MIMDFRQNLPKFPGIAAALFFLLAAASGSIVFSAQNPFETDAADAAPADSGSDTKGSGTKSGQPDGSDSRSDGRSLTPLVITVENQNTDQALIVQAVRKSAPQTVDELMDAVEKLLNVGAVGDAKTLMTQLNGIEISPADAYALVQRKGVDLFYQVFRYKDLAPDAQDFSRKTLQAAREFSVSDQRVGQLVKALSDPDIDVRSAAFASLKRIGTPAYAAMLEVFADANRAGEFPGIRGAVRSLNNEATDVLIAGANSGHDRIQIESYYGLLNLSSSRAIDMLSLLYLSAETPAIIKTKIERRLINKYGGINSQALLNRIAANTRTDMKGRSIPASVDNEVDVWAFDMRAKKFARGRVPQSVAGKVRASARAARLYKINPSSAVYRRLFHLSQLEAAKRLAGPDREINSAAILERFDHPSAKEISELLSDAIKMDLIPAAIGGCELLKEIADVRLLQQSNRPSMLIEAIAHGDRHLQFAAFDAIVKMDPQGAFPGSSTVMALAAFLSKTEGEDRALVGHVLGNTARSYQSIVSGTGMIAAAARNGREFYEAAISSPDLRILMITETLARPSAHELIQLLRNDWRTRQLPIAFVTSALEGKSKIQRLEQSDPLLRSIQLSFNSPVVADQLNQFATLSSSWPVSVANRYLHGHVASEWLMKISADRQQYGFYPLRRHEDAIYRLLYQPQTAAEACPVVAKLGTAKSQTELVSVVRQTNMPREVRQAAVDAFAESVRAFGTLLTTVQIQEQINLVNSEETPADQPSLTATIIDIIKQQAAKSGR